MPEIDINNVQKRFRLYTEERSSIDRVGEEGFLNKALQEFGLRISRGTALAIHNRDGKRYNTEDDFRKLVKGYKRCVEIGTFRGVSTAILAHYCDHVTTIDVLDYPEAYYLWIYAGVRKKIDYCIVDSIATKKLAIEDAGEIDFAFIDGMHSYECVKEDFECVKHAGTVLFHDYDIEEVGRFINELPKEEVTIIENFALWKKKI